MANPSGWHRKRDTPAVAARVAKYNGPEHRAARALYRPIVEAGYARCWRCGVRLHPGWWQVGHDDAGLVIKGPECPPCNRSAGARKGALIVNARRKAARFVRPVR